MAEIEDLDCQLIQLTSTGQNCIDRTQLELLQDREIANTKCLIEIITDLQDEIKLLQAGGGGGPDDATVTQTVDIITQLNLDLTSYSQCSINATGMIDVCLTGGVGSDPQSGAATGTYSTFIEFRCDGVAVGQSNVFSGSLSSLGSNDTNCATHQFSTIAPFQCTGVLTAAIVSNVNNPSYSSFSYTDASLTANAFCIT